jgi:hypothetical protein
MQASPTDSGSCTVRRRRRPDHLDAEANTALPRERVVASQPRADEGGQWIALRFGHIGAPERQRVEPPARTAADHHRCAVRDALRDRCPR